MAGKAIAAVVLDLDDTLIATARAQARARRAVAALGVSPRKFARVNRAWWDRYHHGECSIEQLQRGRWLECGLRGRAADEADRTYRSVANVVHPRRGASTLLRRLRLGGLATVLLTNSPGPVQRQKLSRLGWADAFDAIAISDEIGVRKPDPRAFRLAVGLVGLAPESAVMVGDSLDVDVRGALSAGFRAAIWVTRGHAAEDPRVIAAPDLAGVAATIDRWRSQLTA
jgi:putative hydrolase of the HAD superfamily